MAEGVVLLKSRTKRGKQLIKEHGPFWNVLWHSPYCIALHEAGFFIQSQSDEKEQRWITEDGSPHFFASYSRGTGKQQFDEEKPHGYYEKR